MHETQQAGFRYPDRQRFIQLLLCSGPGAVAEFDKAQKLWTQRGAT